MTTVKHWAATVATAIVAAMVVASGAFAADLGGNCCADLEERIATLEAETARKGNHKMSVTITGQISEALTWIDAPGIQTGHLQVQSNSNRAAQSYLSVNGMALISPGYSAGFILEVGTGGYANGVVVTSSNGLDTNQLYTRQELVYLKSDQFGTISVGKQMLATYGVTGALEGNTGVAHTLLSFAPLTGPTLGSALDIFDGGITDAVKYKSPSFFVSKKGDGVWVEAAWANADQKCTGACTNGANGNLWDLAIKGVKEIDQVEVKAQVGYRNGMVVDNSASGGILSLFTSGLNVQDIKVWSAGVGVKHLPTGVFVNGSWGDFDFSTYAPGASNIKAWEVQAGIEQKWSKLGHTTFYANYARYDLTALGLGTTNDSFGLGVVQQIDQAATDLYLSLEDYQPNAQGKLLTGLTGDAKVIMGGVTVHF